MTTDKKPVNKRTVIRSLEIAVLALCGFVLTAAVTKRPALVILFSNSSNGILRACYCPNSPWGGLAKRMWLVKQIREIVGGENVLLVDTGDLFPVDADPERLPYLLRLYGLMNYDAVAVGDQELLEGLPAWRRLNETFAAQSANHAQFPWLSAGYRVKAEGRAGDFIAKPQLVRTVAGYRIAILSVVGPDAYRFAGTNRPADVELTDPMLMVSNFVATCRSNADVLVVLSHQGIDADRELAKSVPGVDLIIGGHSQSMVCPPEIINGTAICQAGKNGENLGILVLEPRIGGKTQSPQTDNSTNGTPFDPAIVFTPKWRIASRLVPLDTTVDEDEASAMLVDEYYSLQDQRSEKRLREPPVPTDDAPGLLVTNSVQTTVMHFGETKRFTVTLENVGKSDLEIKKVRSKIRWLSVNNYPTRLTPGTAGEVVLDITATNIDRFFRSEYTITSSDTNRIVVMGTINGRIEGDIPGILNVHELLEPLLETGIATDQTGAVTVTAVAVPPTSHHAVEVKPQPANGMSSDGGHGPKVLVEFFYAPGCAECGEMEDEVLPQLRRQFDGRIDLRKYSILDRTNYLHLARLQESLKVRTNEKVSIYLNESVHLGGLKEIREKVIGTVEDLLKKPTDSINTGQVLRTKTPTLTQPETGESVLLRRFESFTTTAIVLAGLVDGINPCAFATIIFFITLMSVAGIRGSKLITVGVGYVAAVFATYLALGFGVFHLLRTLTTYQFARDMLRWLMIVLLFMLAIVSFRDAWMFKKTGKPSDVTLQLPGGIKRKIHEVMRTRLSTANLLLSSVVIGFLVTLLEAVCTGQVYVPTLVFLTRHPELGSRAWGLLVLYNLLFILPLVVVTTAGYYGTKNERLLEWSRSNVIWSKLVMGLFFAVLAMVLFWS